MTPLYCKDTWLPAHFEMMEQVGEGIYYIVKPPVKIKDTDWSGRFHKWTDEGEYIYNYDNSWSMLKDYMSGVLPYSE